MKMQRKFSLITACIAVIAVAFISSCSSKSTPALPKIGPYDNSDQVAATSLLAHWTFDGTNNEKISGKAPTTAVGNSFVTGVKGQALSLANGYLLYPTITALSSANAIPSVTVSLWVNVDNNGTTASSLFCLTGLTSVQPDWNQGPLNVYVETGHPVATDDTLALHSAFHSYSGGNYNLGGDNINDYGVRGTDFQTVLGAKKWVHYVMRYDATGSNIDIFANGVRVSNNNFRTRTTGTPPVGIGPIVMNTPTQVLIGGWPNSATGYTNSPLQTFEGLLTGQIDEVRVYNIALQDTDIGYLYQLELAGR
jgi:Concanavalin A-like lectin/glucanases superfamily